MKRLNLTHSLFGCLMLIVLLGGCKKEEIDLRDPVPEILSITTNSNSIREFQDSLVFFVEYRDGDGDLGENDPNAANLFLTDNRIDVTESFRVQELAPEGADVPITGTLRVVLRSTGITDNSYLQVATYTVYLRDRAGNESNRLTTEDIVITRQ